MLFEFLGGGVPFGEDCEDPYDIYGIICKAKHVEYPDFFKDVNAKSIINQLLSK